MFSPYDPDPCCTHCGTTFEQARSAVDWECECSRSDDRVAPTCIACCYTSEHPCADAVADYKAVFGIPRTACVGSPDASGTRHDTPSHGTPLPVPGASTPGEAA